MHAEVRSIVVRVDGRLAWYCSQLILDDGHDIATLRPMSKPHVNLLHEAWTHHERSLQDSPPT